MLWFVLQTTNYHASRIGSVNETAGDLMSLMKFMEGVIVDEVY